MSAFFINIVNMSISASWIVLAVLLLRLLLKKAPKWITVLLWGVVAVRLICPFTIESVMSLIPSAETISPQVLIEHPEINTGFPILNHTINPIIQETTVTVAPEKSINALQLFVRIFSKVWAAGIAGMILYTLISYVKVKRKIGTAVLLRDNIFQSESVVSPFVLGIIKPKIYLPFRMDEQDMSHVIAHEQAHIRRKDHWWKPFGFLLLAIHWFNPLMWLSYVLLCRDIELACDEKVVKDLDHEQRADYSQALLTCSVNRRIIAACPLAFGEVGVKDRVKLVLHYKKPAFWIIVAAIAASVVLAVCFLTDPATSLDPEMSAFIEEQIMQHHHGLYTSGEFSCADFQVLGTKQHKGNTTVYMWVLYQEYDEENGHVEEVSGAHIPTAITIRQTAPNGQYELVEYWEPREGSHYVKDIREKFPWYLHGKALDSQRYIQSQQTECQQKAKGYFSNLGGVYQVITSPDIIDALQSKFPRYFGLDATKGLAVYIWQMAPNAYSCGLLPGRDQRYSQEELWDLQASSASLDEMRAIVDYYIGNGKVTKDEVTIHAIAMPYSSYAYNIDDGYRQKLKELFWSTNFAMDVSLTKWAPPVFAAAAFDIDGDGREEQCTIGSGPTYGLFTFAVSVWEIDGSNRRLEYFNIFCGIGFDGTVSFAETDDGMKLRLIPLRESLEPIDYAISIEDRNIVLTANGETLWYWGEQGIYSPFAPKSAGRLEAAINAVLKDKYKSVMPDGLLHIENYRILAHQLACGTPKSGQTNYTGEETVYLKVYHAKYRVDQSTVQTVDDGLVPTAITFSTDENGEYILTDYWTAENGAHYEDGIRARFPEWVVEDALNIETYAEALKTESRRQASEYLNTIWQASP